MIQTGVFVSNDPAALAAYAKWVGSTPGNVLNYLNNDSWTGFDSSIAYEINLWRNAASSSIWSVPLTVWGTSLEQIATGAYNDHFLKAAQGLAQTKASSDGNIYVRVGWEFNGDWMPWAAKGHEGAFIDAFQELVTTFRSVSGKFKFVWDTTNDGGNMDPAKAYPGDKYVDVIGTDVYYSTEWDGTNAAKAFQLEVMRPYGLQWQQDFADAHGKVTAISEWGVATNNAGPYIQAITQWMTDHNIVYENYWDSNTGDYTGKLSNGHNPSAGAVYKTSIANLKDASPQVPSAPGADTLTFRVSGDSWQGAPHFVVTVDGKQVGGTLTASASHATGQTQDITLTGNFGSGAHNVAVKFLDDAWGGTTATDRNLYVHQVTLDGEVHAGSTAAGSNGVASLRSTGSTASYVMNEPEHDTLVFRVSGDSYKGAPHFVVTVDGEQVGGTLTTIVSHAAGQTQDITLAGTFGTGPHDVAVKFLDDAWGGTTATDRNLYVHQVSIGGQTMTGDAASNHAGYNSNGVANLLSNGSAEWHI